MNDEKLRQVEDWIAENGLEEYGGALKKDFWKAMNISDQTYYNWLKNLNFLAAVKKGKERYKDKLEQDLVMSLAKVAKGYRYTKRKTEFKDHNGTPIIYKQTQEEVEVQPNVGAAIFLLTNVAPDRWINKMVQDVNAKVEKAPTYDGNEIPEDVLDDIVDRIQEARFEKIKEDKGNGKD